MTTSTKVFIDPELQVIRAQIPPAPAGWLDFNDMPASRARMAARRPVFPPNEGVEAQDRLVPGKAGDPDVKLRIYRSKTPPATATRLPTIYWIHGGGMIMGG